MNASSFAFPLLGLAFVAGGGCQSPPKPATAATHSLPIRVNCYSLLSELLNQEKEVDKLLLIKLESAELRTLIKAIAATAKEGTAQLKAFASQDPALRLDETALPPGEVATRESISHAETRELLTPFNPNFELRLLLTQFQSLSYATHLAKIAAEHEPDGERRRRLLNLSERLQELHGRTFALIRERRSMRSARPPAGAPRQPPTFSTEPKSQSKTQPSNP